MFKFIFHVVRHFQARVQVNFKSDTRYQKDLDEQTDTNKQTDKQSMLTWAHTHSTLL